MHGSGFTITAVWLVDVFCRSAQWRCSWSSSAHFVIDSQRKEREAFDKAETFRRLTESSGEGAKAAIEMLREQAGLKASRSAKA